MRVGDVLVLITSGILAIGKALLLLFVLIILGFYVPIFIDDWNARKIVIELNKMPIISEKNVMLMNPDNDLWQGKAGYIEKKLDELIVIARDMEILRKGTVPVRVGVSEFWRVQGIAYDPSSIVLDSKTLKKENFIVDGLLVHEFAHLLIEDSKDLDAHGASWQKTCKSLLTKTFGEQPNAPYNMCH